MKMEATLSIERALLLITYFNTLLENRMLWTLEAEKEKGLGIPNIT